MLQYKIPQNVQIEDKITSFMTIRQLIICALGGGFAYVLYISLSPVYYAEIWLPPVAFISLLTIAIAFIKINDIRFSKWFLLLMEFMMRPRVRIWDKRAGNELLYSFVTAKKVDKKEEEKKENLPQKNLSALDELSNRLDTNPFETINKKKEADKTRDRELLHAAIMEEHEKIRHEVRIEKSVQDREDGKAPEKKSLDEIAKEVAVQPEVEEKQESAMDKIMALGKRHSPVREHNHVNTQEKPNVPTEHQRLLEAISDRIK